MKSVPRIIGISAALLSAIAISGCTPVGELVQTVENTQSDTAKAAYDGNQDFIPAPESALVSDYSDTSAQEEKFAQLQSLAEQIGEKDWLAALSDGIKAGGHPVALKKTVSGDTASWEGWTSTDSADPMLAGAQVERTTAGEYSNLSFDRGPDSPADAPKVLVYVNTIANGTIEKLSRDIDICGITLGSSPEEVLEALGKPANLWNGKDRKGDYCYLAYYPKDTDPNSTDDFPIIKFECLDGYVIDMEAGYTHDILEQVQPSSNVTSLAAQFKERGESPAWSDIAVNQTSINGHQVVLGRMTEEGLKDTDAWSGSDGFLSVDDGVVVAEAQTEDLTDSPVSPRVVTYLSSACLPEETPENSEHSLNIGGIHIGSDAGEIEKVLGEPTSSWDGDGTRGDYRAFQYLVATETAGVPPIPFYWLAVNFECQDGKVFDISLNGALDPGQDLPDMVVSAQPKIVYPEGESQSASRAGQTAAFAEEDEYEEEVVE